MSGLKQDMEASGSGHESDDMQKPYLEEGRVADIDAEPAYVVDHEAERALCQKFDFRLLPVLALM